MSAPDRSVQEVVANVLDYFDTQIVDQGESVPMFPDVDNSKRASEIIAALGRVGYTVVPTYVADMTIETRNFDNPDRPYQVVPERLVIIEDREYVRCPLHGLIPLAHECAKAPGDHWCRTAAHPRYNPETGLDGLDDQATPHDEWDRVQAMKVANWKRTAEIAVEALRVADLYLDGFVWLSDPEWGELRDIKRASKRAQRRVAVLTERNGLSARQTERLLASHSGGPSTPADRRIGPDTSPPPIPPH